MRVGFSTIFKRHPDGGIEPLRPVRIGGVTLGPGVRFTPGVRFGGVDLALYAGKDLEVEEGQDTVSSIVALRGAYE